MENVKRLPYGIADFARVRRDNLYYVDKTMYLERMESVASFLFFIRPRRFGKSLFINMMRAYYDKLQAPRFDELFSGLWIHEHPTPCRGKYQVLYFDFSQIGGTIDTLEENFNEYCGACIDDFILAYKDEYPQETVANVLGTKKAKLKLTFIQKAADRSRLPLYLIIDEYDNFTNVVLNSEGNEIYRAITHAEGFYRDIFKVFKPMFERIFFTGVSPVTLDDLTSGFNIATNISMDYRFNDMLGFSTEDVRTMVTYYKDAGQLPASSDVEAIIDDMKPWYDNYCFAEEQLASPNRVFNSDMTLRYLNVYVGTQHPPKDMLDPNTKTDYKKMKKLLQLDRISGDRKSVLRKITEEGQIVSDVVESFPADRLTEPNMFVSLLFYYGMLTIRGMRGATPLLGIPNNNVRKQYYKYLLEQYDKAAQIDVMTLNDAFYEMAYEGKWEQGLRYIGEAYKNTSSIRDAIEGERNIQGFFLAYLNLNPYYLTAPEVEVAHGYCDFFLLPDLTHYKSAHSYILELKYLPKATFAEKAEAQWLEAVEQIGKYAAAPRVEQLRQGTQLHKLIMQFEGWELKRIEEIGVC